jgi:hypothetical protein
MLIFALYTVVLVLVLKKINFFKTSAIGGWGIYAALAIKLCVALYFYTFPYQTMFDSKMYMQSANALSHVLHENPRDFLQLFWGFGDVESLNLKYLSSTTYWSHNKMLIFSDTRNVIRANAIFHLIAFKNPLVVLLFNVVVSMFGLLWLYKGLTKVCHIRRNLLFLLIFFLPSTQLWTANLSKEVFIIFGFGLLIRNIFNEKPFHFSTLIAVIILFIFKPYVGAAFTLALLIYFILKQNNQSSRRASMIVFTVLSLVFAWILCEKITYSLSKKQFDFINLGEGGVWLDIDSSSIQIANSDTIYLEIKEGIDKNFYAKITSEVEGVRREHLRVSENIKLSPGDREYYVLLRLPRSGSYIPIDPINGEFSNLILSVPNALFNTFLRPTPTDPPRSLMKWYFVIENYLLIGGLLFALTKIRGNPHIKTIIFLMIASITIALVIGWTTPVLGALLRYKLPITLSIVAATWLLLFPKIDTQRK